MKILLPSFALLIGMALAILQGATDGLLGDKPANFESLPSSEQPAIAIEPTNTIAEPTPPVLATTANAAQQILDRTRNELQRHASIKARIRYQINLFDQQLIGAGTYFQAGAGPEKKMRYELRVQRADEVTSWTQVCDGRFLWTAADTWNEPVLTRLDLKLIRTRQEQKTGTSSFVEGSPWTWAGLPKLIRSLQDHFQFESATSGVLDPGQTAAWALRGTWKGPMLGNLWPEQQSGLQSGGAIPWSNMPGQFPGTVTIYVRQSDYFPLRIEYRRPPDGKHKELTPDQFVACTLLDFTDIELNRELPASVFEYQPAKQQELLDVTENVLLGMGLK
jgi:hypothetical protein